MTERFKAIKAMNLLVLAMNNESAWARWVTVVPDEASDDDLLTIAQSDELMNEATENFIRILNAFCFGDGLFPAEFNLPPCHLDD